MRLSRDVVLPDGLRIPKGAAGVVEACSNRWRVVRLRTRFADAPVLSASVTAGALTLHEPGFRGDRSDRRQQELFSRGRAT